MGVIVLKLVEARYCPKDFIESPEGLIFAVVADGLENGKVLSFLRYVLTETGLQKLATEQANAYLQVHFPNYLYYSEARASNLHAVLVEKIARHYQPRLRLQELVQHLPADQVVADLINFVRLLQQQGLDISQWGITGSVLIGAQKASSDLDLVCYDRNSFTLARQIIQDLLAQQQLQTLSDADWLEAYQRRDCDLSFEEYCWHEQRKLNKVIINARKVDISLLLPHATAEPASVRKLGLIQQRCKILDAHLSFDYPAVYRVVAEDFDQVVCFTATYQGQALAGEIVSIAGQLEQLPDGRRRVIIGSTREAHGEYMKVVLNDA